MKVIAQTQPYNSSLQNYRLQNHQRQKQIVFGSTERLQRPPESSAEKASEQISPPLILNYVQLAHPLETNRPVILDHCQAQAIQAPSIILKNSVITGPVIAQRDILLENTKVNGLVESKKGAIYGTHTQLHSVHANKAVQLSASTLEGDIQGDSAKLQNVKAVSLKSRGEVIANNLTLSGNAVIQGELTAQHCWIGNDLWLAQKGNLQNTTILGHLYAPHQRVNLSHCKVWGNIESNQIHAEHLELDGNLSADYLVSVTGGWINGNITSKQADISLKDLIRAGAIQAQQSLTIDNVFLLDTAYSAQTLNAFNCEGTATLKNDHGELNVINSHCKSLESTNGDISIKASHIEEDSTSTHGKIQCYQSTVNGALSAYRNILAVNCPFIGSLHTSSGNAYIKGSTIAHDVRTDEDGFAKIHHSKIFGQLHGGWQHDETEIENTHIDGRFYARTPI